MNDEALGYLETAQLSQATRTGYDELDKLITKTMAKKAALLTVLKFPELPLYNNPAELAVR